MARNVIKHEKSEIVAENNIDLEMIEKDSGGGFEEADSSAYAIPFVALLQSLSPQIKKNKSEYIDNAEEGMFFNTVTRELYGESFVIVPCLYKRDFVEWIPRDQGGGFVGKYDPDDPVVTASERDQDGHIRTQAGNDLMDTRYFYCLIVKDDSSFEPVVLALASTQVKRATAFNTRMRNLRIQGKDEKLINPPMFAYKYIVSSRPEETNGYSYMGWSFDNIRDGEGKAIMLSGSEIHLYHEAKRFRDMILEGKATAVDPDPAQSVDRSEEHVNC